MNKENKYIYYGILLYFLYAQIYQIISSLLIAPVLMLHWNIYIIPICLILLIIALAVWLYTIKQFPAIKIWYILLVVVVSILLKIFGLPELYFLRGGNSYYTTETQALISNFILTCRTINTIVLICIAFIRYVRKDKV